LSDLSEQDNQENIINEHRITSDSNLDNNEHHLMNNILICEPIISQDVEIITEKFESENEISESKSNDDNEIAENSKDIDENNDEIEKLEDVKLSPKPIQKQLTIIENKSNKLEELLNKSSNMELPSIEEIFNISPLYGSLHPGEAQKLKVTYYE
jgi:hypothetical protein